MSKMGAAPQNQLLEVFALINLSTESKKLCKNYLLKDHKTNIRKHYLADNIPCLFTLTGGPYASALLGVIGGGGLSTRSSYRGCLCRCGTLRKYYNNDKNHCIYSFTQMAPSCKHAQNSTWLPYQRLARRKYVETMEQSKVNWVW